MKPKATTIYIWEGPENITITRGFPMTGDLYKNTKVKHRGMFSRFIPVHNIDHVFVSPPKKLVSGERVMNGWEVVKIKIDYLTHEPYVPDMPGGMIARMATLQNEVEIWKKKYFEERRKTFDMANKERYHQRVIDDFKFAGDVRQKLYPASDMGMGPFGFRYGLGGLGGMPPPSGGTE